MSSYRSKAFYSPPDGSSGSLPITPTEEEEQPTLSTSLPPSLGKLILNRSTPYNLSPPSSFGSSTSSSSSSSITSQQSTMSTSSAFALGGGSVPSSSSLGPPRPHVALLPPPHLKTYQYTNLQPQLPPTPSSLPLNRILLPPLDSIPRHLSTLPQHASASASTSSSLALPPPPPSTIVSQPQLQRPHQPPPVETANSRHDIAFHELREQQHQLQPQQQARASSSSSSFSTPLPQSYLPPPDTTRKPPSTSSTTAADSTAEPNPSGEADYPMMSLVVRKRRRRTSPGELAILDAHFSKNPLPTAHEREVIAKQVEMTPRHIQIWFQNKRQTEKKRLISGGATYPDDRHQPTTSSSGSSSPSTHTTNDSNGGQPSSSSPSILTNDLPLSGLGLVAPPLTKPDGEGTPRLAGKENIPPLHRTNSAHVPLLAPAPPGSRETVDLQRSRSEGVVVMNGGGRGVGGVGIEGLPSRSLSRGARSGSTSVEGGGGGGIMDQVVGKKELPFVSGTAPVGGASGMDIWKNMMSDPPSGGLEEYIGSDDDDEEEQTMLESDDAMDGRGPGIKGIRSTQQRSKQHHQPRPQSSHSNQFTPINSSLSRRLSTTSTASSGSSSNTNTQLNSNTNAAASSSKTPNNSLRPTLSSSSTVSMTTTLARSHLNPPSTTPRHFTKTLSHAQISSGRRNPSASHPLLADAGGARGMRRSASLDWAASRVGASRAGGGGSGRVSLDGIAGRGGMGGSLRKRESLVEAGLEEAEEGLVGGREFGRTNSSMSTTSVSSGSGSKRRRTAGGGQATPTPASGQASSKEERERKDASHRVVVAGLPSPSPALLAPSALVPIKAEDEECARLLLGLFSGR